MRFKLPCIGITRCHCVLFKPKYFIWYCLFGILLVLCVRETLSDEYVICRESHFGNVSDNLSFAKQIEIYC